MSRRAFSRRHTQRAATTNCRQLSAVLIIIIVGPQRACRPFSVLIVVVGPSVLAVRTGCSLSFPRLNVPTCPKCTKLEAASAADQELIMATTMCQMNRQAVTWPLLRLKVSAPKANARAAKVDVDFTLQQYLAGSVKPSKLAIPSLRVAFATVDQATTAFEQLALKARGLYESTPTLLGLSDAALDLMFDW
ncbi:hypothetical protein BDR03DRAFT_982792 [Suillus americanus]|nr:hypothetical protein BDR03DRAFT_982792 [Suillus americanus]